MVKVLQEVDAIALLDRFDTERVGLDTDRDNELVIVHLELLTVVDGFTEDRFVFCIERSSLGLEVLAIGAEILADSSKSQ